MAKGIYTKAQAKRALNVIASKAFKLAYDGHIRTVDLVAIEKLTSSCKKRL